MSELISGFIGLGVMGEPMCRNLCARGQNRVIAFDINVQPLQRLSAHGVETARSPADVMRECDVLFVSLPSGTELEALARGNEGLLEHARSGQIVVDLGTSPLALTRDLANAFGERGAAYLDAPVARTRQAAENGTLAVMVGGDVKQLEKVRPLMMCFASDITYCGAVGSGQVTKILNNMVLFQTVNALSEAYAIATSVGVNPQVLFDALSKGSGDSFALRNHGAKAILPQQFPERAFPVTYALKDLSYALDMARDHHIDAAGAFNVERLFRQAIDAGVGEKYFPVICRLVKGEP